MARSKRGGSAALRGKSSGLFALLVLATAVSGCDRLSSLLAGFTARGAARVYVTNEDSNDVSVIDERTDQVIKTIPIGKRPRGVRTGRDGKHVYVAVSGAPKAGPGVPKQPTPPDPKADGIVVLDTANNAVEKRLPSGRDPEAFAIASGQDRLLVSNEETAEASLIALDSGRLLRSIPVGEEPEGVEFRPDGQVAYVTSESANKVTVIGVPAFERVAEFETAARPRAIAFTPDSREALVTDESGGAVTIVDAFSHVVRATLRLDTGEVARACSSGATPRPMGVVVAPDGRHAYVTTGRCGSVAILDVPARRVIGVVANVGARPWGIGITPDGKKLYVANGPSNDVAVVDTARNRVVRRVKVGSSPWGIALDPR
jgi:YVTN family beta-propeller protein